MAVQQLLQSIADKVRSSASVKSVYGEPVEAEGKTIIPVARVAYGFGGGGGTRSPLKKGARVTNDFTLAVSK